MTIEHTEAVLYALASQKTATRAALAGSVGVSTVTAGKIIDDLVRKGLVVLGRRQHDSCGRPAALLSLAPKKRLAVLDFSGQESYLYLFDLALNKQKEYLHPGSPLLNSEERTATFFRSASAMLNRWINMDDLLGVCFLAPSDQLFEGLFGCCSDEFIRYHAARFFPDTVLSFCPKTEAGCRAAAMQGSGQELLLLVSPRSVSCGRIEPPFPVFDLSQYFSGGVPLPHRLRAPLEVKKTAAILGEVVLNIGALLHCSRIWVDHLDLFRSPGFSEEINICMRQLAPETKMTLTSLLQEERSLYGKGGARLALHTYLLHN